MTTESLFPGLKSSQPDQPEAMRIPPHEYIKSINKKWSEMLKDAGDKRDSKQTIPEHYFHKFIEENPSLLSTVTTVAGAGHHGTVLNIVITKPTLSGHKSFEPDFMIITKTSEAIIPLLIEIESPTKKCLRSNGAPTSEFTQAKSQLDDWKAWLDDETYLGLFRKTFIEPLKLRRLPIRPKFILIMGTRSENGYDKHRSKLSLDNNEFHFMSFDRLCASEVESSMTVSFPAGAEKFKIERLSPDFSFGPNMGKTIDLFEGWEAAIKEMEHWTEERRKWGQDRVAYWRSVWSKPGTHGISDSDTE